MDSWVTVDNSLKVPCNVDKDPLIAMQVTGLAVETIKYIAMPTYSYAKIQVYDLIYEVQVYIKVYSTPTLYSCDCETLVIHCLNVSANTPGRASTSLKTT
jgi:hypothetical protein